MKAQIENERPGDGSWIDQSRKLVEKGDVSNGPIHRDGAIGEWDFHDNLERKQYEARYNGNAENRFEALRELRDQCGRSFVQNTSGDVVTLKLGGDYYTMVPSGVYCVSRGEIGLMLQQSGDLVEVPMEDFETLGLRKTFIW